MNQSKLQVQMLKDGKRTVIIVNGATGEQDELVYKIVSAYYASALNMEVEAPALPEVEAEVALPFEKVEGLTPPLEPKMEIPTEEEISQMESYSIARSRNKCLISDGDYKGLTALEALHKDNEVALVRLHEYATKMKDSDERDEIITTCKQYMVSLPIKAGEFITRERKCKFITNISQMTSVTPFISGYMDVRSFENFASDDEVNNAIRNLAAALSVRGAT